MDSPKRSPSPKKKQKDQHSHERKRTQKKHKLKRRRSAQDQKKYYKVPCPNLHMSPPNMGMSFDYTSPGKPPESPPCPPNDPCIPQDDLWELQFCRWWGWNWVRKRNEIVSKPKCKQNCNRESEMSCPAASPYQQKEKKTLMEWCKCLIKGKNSDNCRKLPCHERKQLQELYRTPCSSVHTICEPETQSLNFEGDYEWCCSTARETSVSTLVVNKRTRRQTCKCQDRKTRAWVYNKMDTSSSEECCPCVCANRSPALKCSIEDNMAQLAARMQHISCDCPCLQYINQQKENACCPCGQKTTTPQYAPCCSCVTQQSILPTNTDKDVFHTCVPCCPCIDQQNSVQPPERKCVPQDSGPCCPCISQQKSVQLPETKCVPQSSVPCCPCIAQQNSVQSPETKCVPQGNVQCCPCINVQSLCCSCAKSPKKLFCPCCCQKISKRDDTKCSHKKRCECCCPARKPGKQKCPCVMLRQKLPNCPCTMQTRCPCATRNLLSPDVKPQERVCRPTAPEEENPKYVICPNPALTVNQAFPVYKNAPMINSLSKSFAEGNFASPLSGQQYNLNPCTISWPKPAPTPSFAKPVGVDTETFGLHLNFVQSEGGDDEHKRLLGAVCEALLSSRTPSERLGEQVSRFGENFPHIIESEDVLHDHHIISKPQQTEYEDFVKKSHQEIFRPNQGIIRSEDLHRLLGRPMPQKHLKDVVAIPPLYKKMQLLTHSPSTLKISFSAGSCLEADKRRELGRVPAWESFMRSGAKIDQQSQLDGDMQTSKSSIKCKDSRKKLMYSTALVQTTSEITLSFPEPVDKATQMFEDMRALDPPKLKDSGTQVEMISQFPKTTRNGPFLRSFSDLSRKLRDLDTLTERPSEFDVASRKIENLSKLPIRSPRNCINPLKLPAVSSTGLYSTVPEGLPNTFPLPRDTLGCKNLGKTSGAIKKENRSYDVLFATTHFTMPLPYQFKPLPPPPVIIRQPPKYPPLVLQVLTPQNHTEQTQTHNVASTDLPQIINEPSLEPCSTPTKVTDSVEDIHYSVNNLPNFNLISDACNLLPYLNNTMSEPLEFKVSAENSHKGDLDVQKQEYPSPSNSSSSRSLYHHKYESIRDKEKLKRACKLRKRISNQESSFAMFCLPASNTNVCRLQNGNKCSNKDSVSKKKEKTGAVKRGKLFIRDKRWHY